MKNVLFFGYKKKQNSLISFFKKKNYKIVQQGQKKLTKEILNQNFDLIISFGYKTIIKKKLLSYLNRPIINLHISYLPYNRGSHPNFWSFIDNTPKGVSIHEINESIDGGKLIARKRVVFKKLKNHTFNSTYKILIREIENLFKKNFSTIILRKYNKININTKGTYHSKKDLPGSMISWNMKVKDYLKFYFR